MRITPTAAGERYIGLQFLEGSSVTEIATEQCCSRRTIEEILRAQMRHLIEVKRPISEVPELQPEPEQVHTEPAV